MSGPQSVLFDKRYYNEVHARQWLTLHDFVSQGKVHETSNYLRFRQREPLEGERYVTVSLRNYPHVKLVVPVKGPPRR